MATTKTKNQLIGSYEIGELLEISHHTLRMWKKRYPSFPQPVGYGERGPRRDSPDYSYDQLMAWLVVNRPKLLIGRDLNFPPEVEE